MTDDYPELPDFLNRHLNPIDASSQHGVVTRKRKQMPEIIWPRKQIERALKLKAKAAKARRKENAKQKAQWRG